MEYKALYRVREVAEILIMSPTSVYKLIKAGDLPAIKLGETKIRGTDLEAFISNYPAVNNAEM